MTGAPVQHTVLAMAASSPRQDTSGAAYVARADGPPDTSGYMWGGYAIGVVILLGYLLVLLRRQADERRRLGNARGD